MDNLIIQVLSGSASPFEEERLKRWREEAPENEVYFQEMSKVWTLTAPEPIAVASGPPPVEAILQAAGASSGKLFRAGPGPEGSSASTPLPFGAKARRLETRRTPWMRFGLLAASVAAVAIGIRAVGLGGVDPMATYQVAAGETATYTLADGSFVRLADGARLQEWEVEGGREVSLDGKGFFAVARDENRPFIVRTAIGNVRVLGTRFQVESEAGAVETLVVEGLVRVSNEQGSVEVPAGNLARMVRGEGPTSEPVPNVYGLLDWPGGTLVFHGTSLSQVAQEVSRHYGRALKVTDSELANRRVTAWFQDETFEAVTESLCLVTEALCTRDDLGMTMRLGAGVGGV
jgi:ferric-dicitrate binding protein FerR (iron transport regulator)